MKLAMVHTTLPSSTRGKEGGVTYYVHRLANQLVASGHELTVFSADPAPPDAAYAVRPLRAPRWATAGFIGRTFALPWFMYRIPRNSFDVIHTHGDDSFFWTRKRVRSLHGSALGELRAATSWKRRLGQAVLYPLELLGGATARRAIAHSVSTRRHFPFIKDVIPYATDMSLYHPGVKSVDPTVLFVGTLGGRKRGRLVLEHFQEVVRPALPNAKLWMVAEVPVDAPGVVSIGKVESEQRMAELYRSAWLFCMPSSYEGFGLPYVEAIASGTPVVTSSNPGAEEILGDGRGGLIVPDSEIGQALLQLLTSDVRRKELAAAGVERARDFSWEAAIAGLDRVYREVAGG
jgi:glycosyltransferase involved in cell wall biosynthesis